MTLVEAFQTLINLVHGYTRLIWFGQPEYKRKYLPSVSYFLGKILGKLFNILGNLNHFFTSRILCFWVGGYDEIEFVFKKKVTEL